MSWKVGRKRETLTGSKNGVNLRLKTGKGGEREGGVDTSCGWRGGLAVRLGIDRRVVFTGVRYGGVC